MYSSEEKSSLDIYIEDLKKYPLLTSEEQIELGKNLKIIDSLNIVDKNNKKELDLEIIFSALSNFDNNEEIYNVLNILTKIIRKTKNDKLLNDILKYRKMFDESNKALNLDELKKYFGYSNINNYISELNLYKELKNYIIYLESREKLINSNLRLVFSVAKKYNNSKYDISDLICEGNIGLIIAVDKFNPNFEVKFSTYATYWIREKIVRFIYANNSMLSISETQLRKYIKLDQDILKLKEETNKDYNINELMVIFNLDYNTIVEYLNYKNFILSLDQPVNEEDDDTTVGELIENENENILAKVDNLFLSDDIKDVMDVLDNREREILCLKYGLMTENNRTYTIEEIAKMFGLTRERIRQLERSAIRKIRRDRGKVRGLKLYLIDE